VDTTQILTILIVAVEMAYTRRGTERQAHIILDVQCNSFGLGVSVMLLVHSHHEFGLQILDRTSHGRQLKYYITIKD
jgi:hypothetical protein